MKRIILIAMFFLISNSFTTLNSHWKKTISGYQAEKAESHNISENLKVSTEFGKLPLYFIPNEGQVNERTLFYAKASRYTLWLTRQGLVFDSVIDARSETFKNIKRQNYKGPLPLKPNPTRKHERDISRLIFLSANENPDVFAVGRTKHKVNYFIGNDESKWRKDIVASEAVIYKELYKNIELKVYGNEKKIEYDWVIKPGGFPKEIKFYFEDVTGTHIDEKGNLIIDTEFGEMIHRKPISFQLIRREKVEVKVDFKKIGENTYGFSVEEYDNNYKLFIDPVVLVYSTYLGGNRHDYAYGIAVDSSGNAYVTGETNSDNFPIQNQYQTYQGSYDVFVTKFSSVGNTLSYSTYIGGSDYDYAYDIAVDSSGNAYVTGGTLSTDFPIQNQYQADQPGSDAFITKLSPTGDNLSYSTYLGGGDWDGGLGIAVDSSGNAYVTGGTLSTDFPIQNQYQTYQGNLDVFVTKFSSTGDNLSYSTYLGGSNDEKGFDIALDSSGNAYVTGNTRGTDFPIQNPYQDTHAGGDYDAFVTKLSSAGNTLSYSTYLGGSYDDTGRGIAIDSSGNTYVTGETLSTDFPIQNPYQSDQPGTDQAGKDVFVTKLSPAGNTLSYSTYLGGSRLDNGFDIVVDSSGNAYVTGYTESTDFPTMNSYQAISAGNADVFITKLSSAGNTLSYSTYLGGSGYDYGYDIAVDNSGNAYVTGRTYCVFTNFDFPTQNPYQASGGSIDYYDSFVSKLSFGCNISGVVQTSESEGVSGVTITFSNDGGTGNTDSYGNYNQEVDRGWSGTATPSKGGYIFSPPSRSYTNITSDEMNQDYIATRQYTLIISLGTGGTTNPSSGTYTYDSGTEVQIEAIPDTGYIFSGWSGDASGTTNPITITMSSDKTITANFIRQYTLTISAGTGGTTNPSPNSYVYDSGTQVSVTALPSYGYQFSGWSGDASGTSNPVTITVDADKSISASFTQTPTGDTDGDGDSEPSSDGGCFIASAAYGSPLHPYLEILRDFRDQYLVSNTLGSKFVDYYYKYSPSVANIIARSKPLKVMVRIHLVPIIVLSYSMVHLGPIVTAGMLLFILVLPIFFIYVSRRR